MKAESNTALGRLQALRHADLPLLFAEGTCPEADELTGTIDGAVLTGSLARPGIRTLRPWRGKRFEATNGQFGGLNRLGLGPVEVHRFRFTARTATSLFSDRSVLVLDHDHPGNPDWIRRFHDEVVRIEPALFLATSHHRTGDDLRLLAYFALALPV